MDPLIGPLVETLKKTIPFVETRSAPASGDYLEGVLSRQQLASCCALLKDALGSPVKDFDTAATFTREMERIVNRLGGVRTEQCVFLKQRAREPLAYATLWPWASDAGRVTLKVGLLTVK